MISTVRGKLLCACKSIGLTDTVDNTEVLITTHVEWDCDTSLHRKELEYPLKTSGVLLITALQFLTNSQKRDPLKWRQNIHPSQTKHVITRKMNF